MSALDLDPWLPPYPPLAARLWPAEGVRPVVRQVVLVLLGIGVLMLAAAANVPFWPVPLTLQPLAVLLLAAAYGPGLGVATTAAYLALGAAGLPVFAESPERGIGLAYLAGPGGGALAGLVGAALVVGQFSRHGWDRGLRGALVAMASGAGVIALCGFAWMAWVAGVEEAWRDGLAPFLPVRLMEVVVAAAVVALTWRLVRRRSRLF